MILLVSIKKFSVLPKWARATADIHSFPPNHIRKKLTNSVRKATFDIVHYSLVQNYANTAKEKSNEEIISKDITMPLYQVV